MVSLSPITTIKPNRNNSSVVVNHNYQDLITLLETTISGGVSPAAERKGSKSGANTTRNAIESKLNETKLTEKSNFLLLPKRHEKKIHSDNHKRGHLNVSFPSPQTNCTSSLNSGKNVNVYSPKNDLVSNLNQNNYFVCCSEPSSIDKTNKSNERDLKDVEFSIQLKTLNS